MKKNLLKTRKVFFLTAAAIPFLFLSCGRGGKTQNGDVTGTLRYQVERLLEDFQWSDELEPGRLSENVSRYGNISDKVKLSQLAIICSVPENSDDAVESVYPYLEGFGLLDVSEIPAQILSSAKAFCKAVVEDSDSDSLFSKESLYSLAFFRRDIEELKSKKELPPLDSFVVGMAFTGGTSYDVPVRFYDSKKERFVDVDVFFNEEGGSWKIDQIQIRKINF